MSGFVLRGRGLDPYENLAVEEALLGFVKPDDCVLYLWQNDKTVVIGKNQNPWKECRLPVLEAEGVRLARRPSGGGAVYHDRGNLNFSFVAGSGVYDTARQNFVIEDALRALGLRCERLGRNDFLLDGRKFSGQAYYQRKNAACHHGTLMVDVDLDMASRCLTPPKAKLEAKGVDSVRSRVVNLRECSPALTVETLEQAITDAFGKTLYPTTALLTQDALDRRLIRRLTERNRSEDWRLGTRFPADLQFEGHFGWGQIELALQLSGQTVTACRVHTDAMDETLAETIEAALTGTRFSVDALEERLRPLPEGEDILRMLR